MIASRDPADLLPVVRERLEELFVLTKQVGIDLLLTSTYRDLESQNALYAQGRTTPGHIVTNARGGQSYHNYRCAFDFVPLVNGKPAWADIRLFVKVGGLGEQVGLEWAGRWTSFKEYAHLQYTGGLTLAELRAGMLPQLKKV